MGEWSHYFFDFYGTSRCDKMQISENRLGQDKRRFGIYVKFWSRKVILQNNFKFCEVIFLLLYHFVVDGSRD